MLKQWGSGVIVGYFLYAIPPPPPPFLTVWRATSGTGSVKKSFSKELTREFLTTKFKKTKLWESALRGIWRWWWWWDYKM